MNQSPKLRTRNWVERNDQSQGVYGYDDENNNNNNNDNNNVKFKTSMIRSILHDYSDAYILVKGIIKAPKTAAQGVPVNNTNKKVIFRNFAPFPSCITEINNT